MTTRLESAAGAVRRAVQRGADFSDPHWGDVLCLEVAERLVEVRNIGGTVVNRLAADGGRIVVDGIDDLVGDVQHNRIASGLGQVEIVQTQGDCTCRDQRRLGRAPRRANSNRNSSKSLNLRERASWETSSERGLLGFNVLRARSDRGESVRALERVAAGRVGQELRDHERSGGPPARHDHRNPEHS